jgi:membrane associated rhomboid family serine protease
MYIDNGLFRPGYITKGVKILMITLAVVYILQVLMPSGVEYSFLRLFGLNVDHVMNGWIWQFATYAFLHGGPFHLLLNLLGLYFLGPELERHLGIRPFFALILFCAILGGLGWFALTYPNAGLCVGASGGIYGLIGAFAGLFPNRQITLLIFFVLPVTMPAWLMAALFGLLHLAYLVNPGASGIAYSAHLAGGIAGYIYVRMMYRGYEGRYTGFKTSGLNVFKPTEPTAQEIDAILDKIARDGIHALSARERAILQKAGRR